MAVRIGGMHTVRPASEAQGGTVLAVPATSSAAARIPTVAGADGSGQVVGWLKTASNTGLASKGLTTGDLSVYSGLPAWGGAAPNITGTHTRRRFNLSTIVAPGNNTTFNECHFEIGDWGNMIVVSGTNVAFNDCDFIFTGSSNSERTTIVAHPFYGAGGPLVINNCRMTGGTLFININGVGNVTIRDVFGYGQDPDNNGGQQHRDGFTCRGMNGTITLERCRFDCNQGATTGAFFTQDTYNPPGSRNLPDPIIVNQCMFEGSGYCMSLEDATDLRVTDCRIRSYGSSAFGPVGETGGPINTTVWTGNYTWANTPPLYQGSLISDPA